MYSLYFYWLYSYFACIRTKALDRKIKHNNPIRQLCSAKNYSKPRKHTKKEQKKLRKDQKNKEKANQHAYVLPFIYLFKYFFIYFCFYCFKCQVSHDCATIWAESIFNAFYMSLLHTFPDLLHSFINKDKVRV